MSLTARLAPIAVVVLALTACGDSAPPPAATPAPQSAPAADAQPIQEVIKQEESAERLLELANEALSDDRLFDPAGDNALEFYLSAIERAEAAEAEGEAGDTRSRRLSDSINRGNLVTQTRMAINDILPYGLVWVERAIRVEQYDEAERVLGLLQRAQLGAASLDRLRDQLADARTRSERELAQAEQRAAAAEAAAARAAEASSAPAPATPTPEPTPTQPVAQQPTTPPPTAAQPTPTQPAVTQQPTTPPPAQPAPSTPPPAAAPVSNAPPRLISQPTMRYPTRALRAGTEGFVQVSFTIMPDGSTSAVQVTRSDPRGVFDREAVRLVEGLKFVPPGRQIRSERQIDFRLNE